MWLGAAGLSGCCMFVPCDRLNHVAGYVRDSSGKPIPDAIVEFYGVVRRTDATGCFHFGGALAASYFDLRATKEGYSTYAEEKPFAPYDVAITLEADVSARKSHAEWREITPKWSEDPCRRKH